MEKKAFKAISVLSGLLMITGVSQAADATSTDQSVSLASGSQAGAQAPNTTSVAENQAVADTDTGVNNLVPYTPQGTPITKPPRPESAKVGPMASLGDTLHDHGIDYQGLFFAAAFNNPSTGAVPGHVAAQGTVINDIFLDMDKLAGIHGGKFHIGVVAFPFTYPTANGVNFGTYASSYLGSDQYTPHSTGAPWLNWLTYEQTFMNDRLNVMVGKMNLQLDPTFFQPNCGLDFSCPDTFIKADAGLPDPSLGTLGARVRYDITPSISVAGGLQQLRFYPAYLTKNGWDLFNTSDGIGTFFIGGLGYHTDFTTSAYPSRYQVNYYYTDTRVSDPYYSVNGNSVVLNPTETAASHRGTSGVELIMQQTVWSETGATAASPALVPRNLAVYSTIEHSFDPTRPIGWELTAGATLTKPFDRNFGWFSVDQINLKSYYLRLNRNILLAQRDQRFLLGGLYETTSPNQYRFELSSTLSLGRWVKLEPTVQYILNPDSSQSPGSARLPRTGWVVGAILAITFGNTHL